MGDYARRRLEQRGYEVLTGTPIKQVRENEVVIGEGEAERTIPTRTVIWTGGVRPAPLVAQVGVEVDRAGRAIADPTMATSRAGVFAIGDCARIPNVDDPEGPPHAGTAQNAVREAKALAYNILAHIDGKTAGRSVTGRWASWPPSATTPASAWCSASGCVACWPGSCGAATTGAARRASIARRTWRWIGC